ncbi:MAG: hypothetical protein RI932_1778 [Pseudomonadota bacterium]|jgi:tartrate-resistant acid phosphatase type 5
MWWIIFVIATTTAFWQAWEQIPRLSITHEMMGRMNDPSEVRLIFVGDTGTGSSAQKEVAEQMESLCRSVDPTGVILLGDNFYQTGVESVMDPLWESRFEKMYIGECLEKLPFYAILGNHDYRAVPEAQIAYTRERGGRWSMPARYYSLRFGPILEVGAVDTNFPDRCGIPGLCSIDWLMEKLQNSTAAWKILVGHHPIFSGGKYRRLKWLAHFTLPELYCRSGASAYISGHDHGLQHLHGKTPQAKCEIEQFVSGGGGAELYPIERIPEKSLYAESVNGVLIGRFTQFEQRYEFFPVGTAEPQYTWATKKEK